MYIHNEPIKVLLSLYAKSDTIIDDINPESFEFEDFASVEDLVRHTRDVEGSADYYAGNLIYDPDAEFDQARVELINISVLILFFICWETSDKLLSYDRLIIGL